MLYLLYKSTTGSDVLFLRDNSNPRGNEKITAVIQGYETVGEADPMPVGRGVKPGNVLLLDDSKWEDTFVFIERITYVKYDAVTADLMINAETELPSEQPKQRSQWLKPGDIVVQRHGNPDHTYKIKVMHSNHCDVQATDTGVWFKMPYQLIRKIGGKA